MKKYPEKPIKVPRFEEGKGFYTTTERSHHMAKIKGKNTKPELLLRKELFKNGIRFRANVNNFPGKPDLVNQKKKFVIFVDGGFWHGFQWEEKKKRIKSNREFWIPKIERNMQRDRENDRILTDLGFKVFRFWDFQIMKELDFCVGQIKAYINRS